MTSPTSAPQETGIGCAVIALGDRNRPRTIEIAKVIVDRLTADAEGRYRVVHDSIVKSMARQIKGELAIVAEKSSCKAVIFGGGTGFGSKDSYQAVVGIMDSRLDAFGQIFATLNYQENGSSAVMERAVAGTYRGRIIIALPGSPGGAALAMDRLVLPELANMVATISPKL